MRTILVTGAAGFIGSNLTPALLERGYTVIGLDNLSHGTTRNMAAFAEHQNFEFHQADIRDTDTVEKIASRCQALVHLAAYKIPRYSDALDTLHINAFGSDEVFRAAAKYGLKTVAASTSDVYGANPALPFSEESKLVMGQPTVKRWSYAISKLFDEQLLFAYRDRFGIDVVVLRFFGGYGPHQHRSWWGGPQSVFIDLALQGKPLPVHGDGSQTRSFTYVADHVRGIIQCLEKDDANNHVFNLGSEREIRILDLAHMIWYMVREDEPRIEIVPYSTFGTYEDVPRRVPDVSKAKEILGFVAEVGLEEGLRITVDWERSERSRSQTPAGTIREG